ncbi:MAG TPA: T9SS type A sorting domain-containing protein [Flavobacteriales bacterium]|nr:T9SS type A sorting domain-containing protein [Flavobacteriales bacterium]
MKMKLFILISVFLITNIAIAQVQINTTGNYSSPSYLIDNALIGNGVVTSNHSFIGDPSQISFFSDSLALIGMDSGFVLSTGGVDSIGVLGGDTLWWDYIWDSTFTVIIDSTPFVQNYGLATDLMGVSDPDLLIIANSVPTLIGQTFIVSSTNDVAILEFDFVPSSDTLKFNYVFASEEYLTFVNTAYNDVFAFLISGPGITGPYASPNNFPNGAMNIAEVPNSNPSLPITISTVNNTTNSQYYNHDTVSQVSAFNGYTDVFTATAVVTACETYHIKLAIADGSDGTLDSGVFFEAGSFNSTEPGAPNAQVSTTDVLCNGDSSGTASICIQGGTAPYTINWNGQNPNTLIAGNYSVTVFDAIGSMSVTNFTINEPTPLMATISQPILDLEANPIGGTPNFTYQWVFTNVVVGTNATHTPTQNGDYTVVVTDANGCKDTSSIFTVTNVVSGISEYLSESVIVFPNPFTEKTTIKLLNKTDIVKEISLYSPIGQKVKLINNSINKDVIILERGNLVKGIYMLLVRTENYTLKSKLVIK